MQAHICKHGMLRRCSASRCGFCKNKKKRPDDVKMPSAEIDKFNENLSMLHFETLKDCRSLIKKQSGLIDELFERISNLNYQQHVLLEVTKRSAMAISAIKDEKEEEAARLIESIKPMMEEAFVLEKENKNEAKKEDKESEEGEQEGDEEAEGPDEA